MNFEELYHSVIAQAVDGAVPKRRTPVTLLTTELGPPMKLAWSGFYPNRWVDYCDDYLRGGPSLGAWLKRPRDDYFFSNGGHHARGACVTDMRLDGQILRLTSRACNWVPTGVLDLKLAQMVCERLHVRRLEWTIDDLNVDPCTVVSYHRFDELEGESEFAQKARALVADTSDAQLEKHASGMLGRHKKAIRRARVAVVSNEDRIEKGFTFAIARDFVWMNAAVRESWVRKVTGKRGYGEYQWDHLDYPGLDLVFERAGRRPTLDELAAKRAGRG